MILLFRVVYFIRRGLIFFTRKFNSLLNQSLFKIITRNLSTETQCKFKIPLPKQEINPNNTIWTLWLQGEDSQPNVVRKCIESFYKVGNNKRTIILSLSNLTDFIELPDEIINKYKNNIINHTALSEIIRLEILSIYGGIWLDSTVFIPYECKIDFESYDFFSPRASEKNVNNELFGLYALFFLYCKPNYQPVINIRNNLLSYWLQYNEQVDYFLVDYLFKFEYHNNNFFKEDVDRNPIIGKNLHSLEHHLLNEEWSEHLKFFLQNDPLGAFKLNYKVSYKNFSNSNLPTLYNKILSNFFSDNQ